ncbi:hypothetical protein EYA88_16115 [Burkholderia pseudomallei]|nr:hypothetical protein EYA82_16420 [Burkholderia pseudomallei]QBL86055.1 hypothetical protein EYA88_16115 [Burkholderia pseudomallei]QBP63204.1 hypothetical protein E2R29_16315 [Burkholderia pseudomallei]
MRIFVLPCLSAAMLVSACNHSSKPETSAVATSAPQHASTSAAGSANTPAALPVPAAMPAPPPHQYAMEQDGTYGYEPALSEDDVRSGKATKPLVMMRYVGRRDGTYVLLLIDPDNENYATRVTCQAPCNFAKLQTMSGTMVLKTETIRVAPNSLIGAMLDDALSGQLRPYGQTVTMPRPTAVPSTAQPADQSASQDSSPQSDLQRTSFDCSKVGSIPEYLICHDPELAASDRELANIYQQAKDAVPDKAAFAARTRRQWNFRQRNCRDKPCLVSWYAYQKETLTKIAQTGDVNAQ